ncbi:cytochrome P450 4C1-like isoform X2 [Lycorma delicatula]|uniref:cytochrome P450 4C1-like isoform X2 n=1 Tax=Lycorma delicatula TaxID=130591 RepID=UPI003F51411F
MIFEILIVIFFIVLFTAAAIHEWPSTRTIKLLNKFNGPPTFPLLGNTLLSITVKKEDLLLKVKDYCEEYGSAFKLWFANSPYIILNDAKYLEVLLNNNNHIEKGFMYRVLRNWLKEGLLISSGSKWQYRRKLLISTFHFKILEGSLPIFNNNSQILVKELWKSSKKFIEIESFISRCSLDIICEAAMGVSLNGLSDKGEEYLKAIRRINNLIMIRMFSPWLYNEWIYSLTPNGREYFKILRTLHTFTKMIITERKERKISNSFTNQSTKAGKKNLRTFLDFLLELNETDPGILTFDDIKEEVDTFMFEGYDTSSAAISSAIFILGHNPDIQECLFEELDEVFGDSDREVTMEDLNRLSYLDRIIKETLRLFPSVPCIIRKLYSDLDLGHEGYIIPATTNVVVLPYTLHRNSKYYPNPEKFDPDRFLPEEVQKRHPFAYIPFSGGPRNCIDKMS